VDPESSVNLWIPGSLALLAPRNDGSDVFWNNRAFSAIMVR
jgi:hypothetical protein